METLEAKDGSVNFIWRRGEGQALEARFVVREEGELICYLSSQTACARACRMCHLTRTGQVNAVNSTLDDFRMQAMKVLSHKRKIDGGKFWTVSYNFMARGEPLDNPVVDDNLLKELGEIARSFGLVPRFKISTIMPVVSDLNLINRFAVTQPDIYYSLYSTCPPFRKKWLPKAIHPQTALNVLKRWQDFSHKIPRIHFPLIRGQNDAECDIHDLVKTIQDTCLRVDYNIVRYNPYDELSREGNWERARDIITALEPQSRVQVVSRVGLEAKASCGMFVS